MKRTTNIPILRTAAMLLLMLLTVCTAWAQPDQITLSEDSEYALTQTGHYYVNMPANSSSALEIPSTVTSFKVYDDGGKEGFYGDNCNGYLYLTAPEGYIIQLSGKITIEHDYDKLTVWSGTDTSDDDAKLINAISSDSEDGTGTVETDITPVTSTGRYMTLLFNSDGSYNYSGLDLTVTLVSESGGESNPVGINATTEDIGKVICTDGSIYATCELAWGAYKTPVAMIAHFDEQSKTGLAIAFEDEKEYNQEGGYYTGSLNWETAKAKTAAHTPIIEGILWKLPSIEEWKQMLISCGGTLDDSNPYSISITDSRLSSLISAAGGDLLSVNNYWSATEAGTDYNGYEIAMCPMIWNDNTYCNASCSSTGRVTYGYSVRACFAFTVGGGDSGNVITSNTGSINMPKEGTDEYTIAEGVASFNIYDDGGAESNYSDLCDGSIVLIAPEGCTLKLTGSIDTESSYDFLKVWDGSTNSGDPVITLNGNNSDIDITSTGRSLTLNFSSDSGVSYTGLDLTVTVVDPNAVSSTYAVTINDGTGGYVSFYGEEHEFEKDANVSLYISPYSGYVLSNLSVVDADNNPVNVSGGLWYNNSASFTMPASNVTVTPTFTNNLTSLSINMPDDNQYAYIPNGVQSFKLYDDGGQNGNYSEGNRSIVLCAPENYLLQLTGTITALNYERLTVKDGYSYSNTQLFYAGSSSNGVTTDIGTIKSTGRYMRIEFQTYGSYYSGLDLTVTLISNAAEYDVTISPASGGTVVAKVNNTQVTKAKVNDVVTLTATPAAGYVLSGISVVDGNSNAVSVTGGTWYNNTATFSMPTSVATVTPVFTNTLTGLSINMPTEGTVTATIPEGVSSFKVYDDGGENGAYSSNCNGNLVLTAPEGNMLQLTGTVTTNADAYITVWNGSDPSNDEAKLINQKSSSTTNNATSIGSPTSTNRSMTLNFTSGFSVFAGLDLTVTQINVCLADAAENSTVIGNNNNRTGRNVLLADRTLYKDGEWNTICLPFNVSLSDSPLAGATAKTLTSATMTGTTVSLTFGDAVTTLQAGVPYIIKWAKAEGYDQADPAIRDIVNPLFTGVTVVSSTEAQRTIEKADGHVKFIGYYDPMTIDTPDNDDIYYMTTGNTLKHTGKQRTLKACRAYFQFSEAAQQARSFVLNFGDDNTTAVANSTLSTLNSTLEGEWYTLDGVKLDKQPTKKGLYIFNGRKIVIK